MKKLPLVLFAFAASALSAAAPGLPEFNSKTLHLPPLSLSDLVKGATTTGQIQIGAAPLFYSKAPTRLAPSQPAREYGMPVVKPNETVDYKLKVQAPDPTIDYKLKVLPVEGDAAK